MIRLFKQVGLFCIFLGSIGEDREPLDTDLRRTQDVLFDFAVDLDLPVRGDSLFRTPFVGDLNTNLVGIVAEGVLFMSILFEKKAAQEASGRPEEC